MAEEDEDDSIASVDQSVDSESAMSVDEDVHMNGVAHTE